MLAIFPRSFVRSSSKHALTTPSTSSVSFTLKATSILIVHAGPHATKHEFFGLGRDGMAIIEQRLSVDKIRKYFHGRPAP